MRKAQKYVLLFTVLLVSIGFVCNGDAQEKDRFIQVKAGGVDYLKKGIEKRTPKINEWEHDATVVLGLSVTVALLGILTGLLQSGKSQVVRFLTIVVGTTISIIVVINEKVYEHDHRTLMALATDGRFLLDRVKKIIDVEIDMIGGSNMQDLKLLLKEGDDSLKKFDRNARQVLYSKQLNWDFISSAYALNQSDKIDRPDWMAKLPKSDGYSFYIGFGSGTTLSMASRNALDDALGKALTDNKIFQTPLIFKDKIIEQDLKRKSLKKILEKRDRFFIIKNLGKKHEYSYYLLSAVNINSLNDTLAFETLIGNLLNSLSEKNK